MAAKKIETQMGRPKAIRVTPEQFEIMSQALKDAATHLADVAKFMRENELETMLMVAAKMMDEHLPAAQAFARRAWAEVGPAATANRLNRRTRLQVNQERYAKAKSKKPSP